MVNLPGTCVTDFIMVNLPGTCVVLDYKNLRTMLWVSHASLMDMLSILVFVVVSGRNGAVTVTGVKLQE